MKKEIKKPSKKTDIASKEPIAPIGLTSTKQWFFAAPMSKKSDAVIHFEKPNLDYVLWGENHFIPLMYINLKNDSPVHGSIIESKAADVAGEKIVLENPDNIALKNYLSKINRYGNTGFDEIKKIAGDFVLFGGFAYQIIYNKFGTAAEIFHVPFETVVPGKKDEFGKINNYFISEDWAKSKPKFKVIPAFNPNVKEGSQIYYCNPFNIGCNYFPIPEYAKGIKSIETEIRLNTLYHSFVKNGFFASAMINFNNGIPTEEEADEIYRDIIKQFSGDENGGKILVNFANSKEEAAEITVLPITDADKLFTAINTIIESKIHKAHRITSPILVGDRSSANLGGGANELLVASELYFNTVIKPKQKIVESEFNYILNSLGFVDGIKIIPNQPVSFSFSENVLTQILTKDELRAKIGYKPLDEITPDINAIN